MRLKKLSFSISMLCCLFSNALAASDECIGLGIITSMVEMNGVNAAKVDDIDYRCQSNKLNLEIGDIILSINGNPPNVDDVNNLLFNVINHYPEYIIEILLPDGSKKLIDQPKTQAEDFDEANEQRLTNIYTNPNSHDEDLDAPQYQLPIYQDAPKVSSQGGLQWIKWMVIFILLSFTLSPAVLMFFSKPKQVAYFFAGAALLGAAKAKGNPYRGAYESIQLAAYLTIGLLILGPLGIIYTLYHPITTAISDSDKTYCCAMTFLGSTDIANRDISPDGRWLVEIREAQYAFMGLGDKELPENYLVTVMDLSDGKYIKWPQTGSKFLGIESIGGLGMIKSIDVSNGIYISPYSIMPSIEEWIQVDYEYNYTKPINSNHVSRINAEYVVDYVDSERQSVNLTEIASGKAINIYSKLAFNTFYLSKNGKVLALVKAEKKKSRTDGAIKDLMKMASSFVLGSWAVEFWDVTTGTKIKSYSGNGISKDDWKFDRKNIKRNGQTKFLESSENGMLWYMIKKNGYIHVFDMNKYLS